MRDYVLVFFIDFLIYPFLGGFHTSPRFFLHTFHSIQSSLEFFLHITCILDSLLKFGLVLLSNICDECKFIIFMVDNCKLVSRILYRIASAFCHVTRRYQTDIYLHPEFRKKLKDKTLLFVLSDILGYDTYSLPKFFSIVVK